MERFAPYALPLARLLLAAIFILSGFGKITGYAETAGYMESRGVPGILLPIVILVELGGGLLIVVGWQTRLVSLALAAFTFATALIFHNELGDRTQMIQFMKNLAITGGFLALFASGPGALSVDGRKG